jgi:hypothetical protein
MASRNKSNQVYNAEFNRAIIDSLRVTRLFFSNADIHYIDLQTPSTITQGGLYIINESSIPTSGNPLLTINTTAQVIIHGQGQTINTTVLPAAAQIITTVAGSNVQIIGLNFLGRAGGTQVLVQTASSSSFLMQYCLAQDYATAVRLTGTSTDITVSRNHFARINRDVEQVDGASCNDLLVFDNYSNAALSLPFGFLTFLRGSCINCTTECNKTTLKHSYNYNCTNCSVSFNDFFDNVGNVDSVAVLCGGDATPSAPTNPGADLGCTNCHIEGNKITQLNVPANSFFAYGGVLCLYSKGCMIRNNQIHIEEPTKTTLGAAVTTTYCEGCTHDGNQISGSGLLAEFACDIYDLNIFCRGTVIQNAKVSGFYSGLCAFRCLGMKVSNCHISNCDGGILCSEGVENCLVRDCSASSCTAFGLFNGVLVAGPGIPFSDVYAAPPVNTNLINNSFHGTVGGIVQPVAAVLTGFNVVN